MQRYGEVLDAADARRTVGRAVGTVHPSTGGGHRHGVEHPGPPLDRRDDGRAGGTRRVQGAWRPPAGSPGPAGRVAATRTRPAGVEARRRDGCGDPPVGGGPLRAGAPAGRRARVRPAPATPVPPAGRPAPPWSITRRRVDPAGRPAGDPALPDRGGPAVRPRRPGSGRLRHLRRAARRVRPAGADGRGTRLVGGTTGIPSWGRTLGRDLAAGTGGGT